MTIEWNQQLSVHVCLLAVVLCDEAQITQFVCFSRFGAFGGGGAT